MKFLASLLFLSFPTLLSAATAAKTATPAPSAEISLWEMIHSTGWVIYPLVAASFAAVFLIIYYFVTLRASQVATDEARRMFEAMIREGNLTGALEAAKASPQALARVIEQAAGFLKENPEAGLDAVREVAQAEGSRQAAALTQRVLYLMDIGVLAPMLGLFGTVVGILRSFNSIALDTAAVSMRATVLAGGVSQALVATAAGLLVGITAMFFYSYFRGRVNGLISQLESTATILVAQMGLKLRKG